MARKHYKAVRGSGLNNKQAQIVGEALDRIPKRTPEAVVAEAKKKTSPLHPFFEWDDTAAAEAHRLWQARHLFCSVRIVVRNIEVKAFHSVAIAAAADGSKESSRVYVSVGEARNNDDHREQILANAMRELKGWRTRYENFREALSGVFDAIDEVLEESREAIAA